MKDFEKYELIDRYLSGKMSGEELKAFEIELAQNAELSHEVESFQWANDAIVDFQVASFYTQLEKRNPYQNKPHRTPWKGAGGLSIALLGGLALTLLLSNPSAVVRPSDQEDETAQVEISESKPQKMNVNSEVPEDEEVLFPQVKTYTNFEEEADRYEEELVRVREHRPGSRLDLRLRQEHKQRSDSTDLEAKTEGVEEIDSLVQSQPDSEDPCLGVTLVVDNKKRSATPTCMDAEEGEISFLNSAVTGGAPPYFYSLNDKQHYRKSPVFTDLSIGEYRIYIKDSKNCELELPLWATIRGKDCNGYADYSFNPEISDFTFPVPDYSKALIDVINLNAESVFRVGMDGTEAPTWNGRSISGSPQAAGVYVIRVIYEDNSIEKFTLSLVR